MDILLLGQVSFPTDMLYVSLQLATVTEQLTTVTSAKKRNDVWKEKTMNLGGYSLRCLLEAKTST